MAKRRDVQSQNAGLPKIQTNVRSYAATQNIKPDVYIDGESEAAQIGRSLGKFANSLSGLFTAFTTDHRTPEQLEIVKNRARVQALQGRENTNPDDMVASKAYNRQIATNKFQSFMADHMQHFKSETGAAMGEQAAKDYMQSRYDDFISNLAPDDVNVMNELYAKSYKSMWGARDSAHKNWREDQMMNEWESAVLMRYRRSGLLPPEAQQQDVAASEGWLRDQLSLPIMGMDSDKKRERVASIAQQLAAEGNDTLLRQLEARSDFVQNPGLSNTLRNARNSFDAKARTAITEDNLNLENSWNRLVSEGATDQELEGFRQSNPEFFANKTANWYAGQRRKSTANRNEATTKRHVVAAARDGYLNKLPLPQKERTAAIDAMIAGIVEENPSNPEVANLQIAEVMAKNGYVSNAMKQRFGAISSSLPMTKDQKVSQDFKDMYNLYDSMRRSGYGKFVEQFGEKTVATMETMRTLMKGTNMDIDAAAHTVRQMNESPLDHRQAVKELRAVEEESFADTQWFGNNEITDPTAKAEIRSMASMYLRGGVTKSPEGAMKLARAQYEERHPKLNGHTTNVPRDVIKHAMGTNLEPEDAIQTLMDNPRAKKMLMDTLPDMGLTPDDVTPDKMSFMFSPDGKQAWMFYNDENGVAHKSGVVLNTSQLGAIARAKEERNVYHEIITQGARNKYNYAKVERDIVMALRAKDMQGGGDFQEALGLTFDSTEIPVESLDEWESLSPVEKNTIIQRLSRQKRDAVPTWWDEGSGVFKRYLKSPQFQKEGGGIDPKTGKPVSESDTSLWDFLKPTQAHAADLASQNDIEIEEEQALASLQATEEAYLKKFQEMDEQVASEGAKTVEIAENRQKELAAIAEAERKAKQASAGPINVDNPDEADVKITKALAQVENSIKKGYSKKKGLWFPHASVEGGTPTIAYGHKLTKAEHKNGVYKNGITQAQAEALLRKDIKKHADGVKKNFPNWNKYPRKYQMVLAALAFNVGIGGVKPSKWKNLTAAIERGDDKAVRRFMTTSYRTPKGKRVRLTSRATTLADAIGLGK